MKSRNYSFLFIIFLLSACKTYSPDQLPESQLRFGNGGGFAGIETTYTLLENGQLFKSSSVDTVQQELNKTKIKNAKQVFEQMTALQLDSIDLNSPGNVYQFVEKKVGTQSHRVVWTGVSEIPALDSLYHQLVGLTVEKE